MNWDAVSAIGEILGTLVVFITLGYLAVQLKQARAEVERSISHSRTETVRDLLMMRATNERLGKLYVSATLSMTENPPAFVSGVMERTELMAEEAAALYWDQLAWWQYRLEIIPHLQQLSSVQRQEFESGIRQNYGSQPLERLFYQTSKSTFPRQAVSYIDGVLAQADTDAN
jgi:hypothetical protein